jgi:hypothetical protein
MKRVPCCLPTSQRSSYTSIWLWSIPCVIGGCREQYRKTICGDHVWPVRLLLFCLAASTSCVMSILGYMRALSLPMRFCQRRVRSFIVRKLLSQGSCVWTVSFLVSRIGIHAFSSYIICYWSSGSPVAIWSRHFLYSLTPHVLFSSSISQKYFKTNVCSAAFLQNQSCASTPSEIQTFHSSRPKPSLSHKRHILWILSWHWQTLHVSR